MDTFSFIILILLSLFLLSESLYHWLHFLYECRIEREREKEKERKDKNGNRKQFYNSSRVSPASL